LINLPLIVYWMIVADFRIILENFDIVSLAEFGSGTFGKTGTNTVVLFLRRKETNTPAAEHYQNRVKTWFATGDNAEDIYQDEHLLQAYCDHCGYRLDDYRTFLKDGIIGEALFDTEVFKAYRESFDSTDRNAMKGVCDAAKDIRNRFRARSKTKTFRKQTEPQKKAEKEKALCNFIISIEQEKIYIFLLAFTVNTPVLIVKSPTKTAAIKKFLGYEWSDSKGNEGIEYLHLSKSKSENDDEGDDDDTVQQIRGINGIRTPLFNPDDLYDSEKINTLIRQNFLGEYVMVPEDLSEFVSQARLVDLIDFKRTAFDKAIKTSGNLREPVKEFGNDFNYEPIKLIAPITSERIDFSKIISSEYITTDNMLQNFGGVESYAGNPIQGKVNCYHIGDILMSNIRPYLNKIWISNRNGGCSSDVIVFRPAKGVLPSYIGCILQRQQFVDFVMADIKGLKMPRGNKSNIERYLIPIPPKQIQQTIVAEFEAVDKEVEEARKEMAKFKLQVELAFSNATKKASKTLRLCDSHIFSLCIGRRVVSNEIVKDGQYKVVSANVHDEFGRISHSVLDDFSVPSVLWGIDGDWMVNYIEKDILFAPTDHCGVIRVLDEKEILPKYLTYSLLKAGEQERYSRSNRASTERVRALTITVPDINTQKNVVTKVQECETKIAEAQATINSGAERKQAILDKYLK
ncbi:MAG: restriction endonuclease subunit S, partial [Prevotella sp.]|nr:restriction endonuclease subunit S [Prevotella sp.]